MGVQQECRPAVLYDLLPIAALFVAKRSVREQRCRTFEVSRQHAPQYDDTVSFLAQKTVTLAATDSVNKACISPGIGFNVSASVYLCSNTDESHTGV